MRALTVSMMRPLLPVARNQSMPPCLLSMVAFQRTLPVTRPMSAGGLIVLTFWLANIVQAGSGTSSDSDDACRSAGDALH